MLNVKHLYYYVLMFENAENTFKQINTIQSFCKGEMDRIIFILVQKMNTELLVNIVLMDEKTNLIQVWD